MSRELNKDDIIVHKKKAIKELNNTLEHFINRGDVKGLKKANLIAYWIEEYSEYLRKEECFDYKKVMKYKRGDVIQLNFGFNVGSEHGGLHYAIVLDNDNLQSSPVVTVVPLSSGTENDTYPRDVFLGNELYEKLNNKYTKLSDELQSELNEIKISEQLANYYKIMSAKNPDSDEKNGKLEELVGYIMDKKSKLTEETHRLNRYKKEVDKLKQGSIAMTEQITTVSKMRIYKPKNSDDLLYNITFSDGALDKITSRIKELYIFTP